MINYIAWLGIACLTGLIAISLFNVNGFFAILSNFFAALLGAIFGGSWFLSSENLSGDSFVIQGFLVASACSFLLTTLLTIFLAGRFSSTPQAVYLKQK
jgi:uncharacterized membrane protein YeaQ/YmgE (transglycosylase-associated protein family)